MADPLEINDEIPSAPPALPIADLQARITELAGHLNAASHRWLVLIAEFDRREGWADGSTQSCAHWLGWKCGLDLGAAREKVRVARALTKLPQVSAAMARGALSYSKVRAITRIATPATEETLLMIALHGTAHHVETVVRHYRRAQESIELDREARQVASRGLHYHYDQDGSLVLQARLPAETGALLVKALEQASDVRRDRDVSAEAQDVSAETAPTLAQRRADALARFAETWLAHGDQALSGGERQQIVVHVDVDSLRAADTQSDAGTSDAGTSDTGTSDTGTSDTGTSDTGTSDAGTANADTSGESAPGRCELEDGPALAVQTARRLACDASIVRIVEDAFGRALDVGRKTRSIPPAIRRALQARDSGCRFPGCTHTRFLDGHHIRHWADGGETRLSNLVLLCRFHHRQVHEGRIDVRVLNDGALRFSDAHGHPFEPAVPMAGDVRQIVLRHRRAGLAIDAGTAVTRWAGERIDYGMAVGGLLAEQARQHRGNVSAERRTDGTG
ncbi:MAG: DUF222 domain-containing protein [Burkholderiaceae bacterium]